MLIGGAYFLGMRIARTECATRIAKMQNTALIENEKTKRIVNDTVIHTAVRDIRDILRDKYTIAE